MSLKKFEIASSNNTHRVVIQADRWCKVEDWVYFYSDVNPEPVFEPVPIAVAYKPAYVKEA